MCASLHSHLSEPHMKRIKGEKVHIKRIESLFLGFIIHTMNKNKKIAIALIVASVILGTFGFIALPENIITQFNSSGGVNTMGKIPALIVPLLISIVPAILSMNLDESDERSKKYLMGSVLGILILLVMIGINL